MKSLLLALLFFSLQAHSAEKTQAFVGGVTVTSKSLAQTLTVYVQTEILVKGAFIIEDPAGKSLVKLKPAGLDDGAHLHHLGENSFLSWGEFKDGNGDAYMLDFYFEWKDGGWRMKGPLSVYSKNKVKRYGWDESGTFMKRLPLPKKTASK